MSDQNGFATCLSDVSGLWNVKSACVVPAVVSARQAAPRTSTACQIMSDRVRSCRFSQRQPLSTNFIRSSH